MEIRALLVGTLLWITGTLAIRLGGHHLLRASRTSHTLILYVVSFVLMAWLMRRICSRLGLEKDAWPKAATLVMLPTLILDPFSCVFFTTVFPNLDLSSAGAFGGWMLICCAGAVTGVWVKP
jgi:Family of unknown function (DUF5367)